MNFSFAKMKSANIYVLIAGIWLFLQGCSVEPEPLVYGEDVCHFCKMTLMDNRFGAELVTRKGKIYKFDDASCFLHFYHSDAGPQEDYKYKLIVDYANPGHLIAADYAFYLKSDNIKSPMAGKLAAFEKVEDKDKYYKEWKAIYLSWGEAVTEFK